MAPAPFSLALAAALLFLLRRMWINKRVRAEQERAAAGEIVRSVMQDAREAPGETAGVVTWNGTWRGERAQIRTIVDTLAVRKLPAFWLSVTINEPVAARATFDMMMRPGSATTFSNFDQLAHTVPTPANFSVDAVIRTNDPDVHSPLESIAPHIAFFAQGRAKELLITPHGVRIVWLLAEADRARYGVFRQADFSGAGFDAELLEDLLAKCAAMRAAVKSDAAMVGSS